MAICKNCGVEYYDDMAECPLCSGTNEKTKSVSPADVLDISKNINKRQLWELAMVLIFSAMVVTLAIDAFIVKGINWSLFSSAALIYLGVILTVTRFNKNRYFISGSLMVASLILLYTIDVLSTEVEWFLPIGLPVTISFFILSSLVLYLNSLSKYKGLNLLATIFIAIAIFVVMIETCIDLNSNNAISLRWSVVTSASLCILALILTFIHYRLKRGHSLGRLFHV